MKFQFTKKKKNFLASLASNFLGWKILETYFGFPLYVSVLMNNHNNKRKKY